MHTKGKYTTCDGVVIERTTGREIRKPAVVFDTQSGRILLRGEVSECKHRFAMFMLEDAEPKIITLANENIEFACTFFNYSAMLTDWQSKQLLSRPVSELRQTISRAMTEGY